MHVKRNLWIGGNLELVAISHDDELSRVDESVLK